MADPHGTDRLPACEAGQELVLAVGPQRGFSEDERRRLAQLGFQPVSLGVRRLRAETAALIKKMVEDDKVIRCEKLGLVFNRVRGNEDLLRDAASEIGLDVFGMIPFDENIATHDLLGKPLTELPADSPGFAAFREVVEKRVLR